jgi:hypothetical protein
MPCMVGNGAGTSDPAIREKAEAIRAERQAQRQLARETAEPTTRDQVLERIALTRLEFVRELAKLDPKKLARKYYRFLMGEEDPSREQVTLWRDFLAMMMPTLTAAEGRTGVPSENTEKPGGVFINVQAPGGANAQVVEITPVKKDKS